MHPLHTLTPDSHPELQALFAIPLRPPAALYARGSPRALWLLRHVAERGLAWVGTRAPLERSCALTRRAIGELGSTGAIILSGLARGIDGVAHSAALDAGLPTIAVLGAGVDVPYPPEHAPLRERILRNDGLLLSEAEPDAAPVPSLFVSRNRLLAQWARCVIVVQAPARSGALSTASWALKAKQPIWVVPSYPGDAHYAGNERLLRFPPPDSPPVHPFYGPDSLPEDFHPPAAFVKKSSARRPPAHLKLLTDEALLIEVVEQATVDEGGLAVRHLLEWAIARNWTPGHCFDLLHRLIARRVVAECNGRLLKNPTLYP